MGRSKHAAKAIQVLPWKTRITRHLQLLYFSEDKYELPPLKFLPLQMGHGAGAEGDAATVSTELLWGWQGGYLSACIIQSDFEFTFTTRISQLVCRSHSNYLMLRCLLISEILECKTQKTPVCYLQYSQYSGAFLLRSQFLYIFLYRVYLAALIFVVRAMATCDLPGALTQISMVVVEGLLLVRTDFTHFIPSLVPTKPDQTKPHQSSALVFQSYSAVET